MLNRRQRHRFKAFVFYITALVVASTFPSFAEADDQRFVINQSQNFHLDCIVKNFKFEAVASKWTKQQMSTQQPLLLFVDDKPFRPRTGDFARYNTSHVQQTNGYAYSLNIYNTQPQDSGQYVCEVLDTKGNTALRMNFTLDVIDPVKSVILFKNSSSVNATDAPVSPFYYSTAAPGSLGCHVVGGNPRPNVTLSLASNAQTTSQRLLLAERQWIGTDEGFQKPSWQVVLFADRIAILPEYDGTTAVCSVSIETYNASSSNTVLVDAVPYFFSNGCQSEQFSLKRGSTAQLSCRFHAHPVGQVTWSKKMTADDATQDFQSITDSDGLQSVVILDGKNDFIAKLMFPKLNDNNFQFYKLTVSNDLGSNSTVIELSKGSASQASMNNCIQSLIPIVLLLIKTVAMNYN